jgi:hypothetical protein
MGGTPTLYTTQAPLPTRTDMAEGIEFKPREVKATATPSTKTKKLKITPKKADAGMGVNTGY